MKLIVCFAFACLAVVVQGQGNCEVDLKMRISCGGSKRSKASCLADGCCHDDNFKGKKGNGFRCFHPRDPCKMPNTCLYGAECVSKPTHPDYFDGAHDCICPKGLPPGANCRSRQGNCDIAPKDRVACGSVEVFKGLEGIENHDPEKICLSRGCCYNSEIEKTKWCFIPEKKDPGFPKCRCKKTVY